MSSFARVIVFDKRGNGPSDRVTGTPTLEERASGARRGRERVRHAPRGVRGWTDEHLFAATYPTRCSTLILWGTFARFMQAPHYPFGTTPEMLEYLCGPALEQWRELESLWRMNASIDVRDILPSVQTETLVSTASGTQRTSSGAVTLPPTSPTPGWPSWRGQITTRGSVMPTQWSTRSRSSSPGNVTTSSTSIAASRRWCSPTLSGRRARSSRSGTAGGGTSSTITR